ncbi:hypothetical protein BLOT_005778 [Blomia tropicalis]|nr:hypothetical protein BLOT_005778 [Blomia tropicalis]
MYQSNGIVKREIKAKLQTYPDKTIAKIQFSKIHLTREKMRTIQSVRVSSRCAKLTSHRHGRITFAMYE